MTTYELRPLSTGEILDGALVLLRRNFALLLGIAVGGVGRLRVVADLSGDLLRLHSLLLRPPRPQGRLRPGNAQQSDEHRSRRPGVGSEERGGEPVGGRCLATIA